MTTETLDLVLPDIPRIHTALAEWLSCIVYVCYANRRIVGWKFAVFSVAMLGAQALFLSLTAGLESVWWIACMGAAVGMMYLYLYVCGKMNWKECAYHCTGAFVAAEAAASLEWQLYCFLYYGCGWEKSWLKPVCLLLIFGLFYACMWWLKGHRRELNDIVVTNRELVSYIMIGIAVFLFSNLGFISIRTPYANWYAAEIFRVRTIVDLGGLAILHAYHLQRAELRTRHELENIQMILENQYMQYQQAQEAVDIINYKYHDLKHHILVLRTEENDKRRNQYLDRMEEEICAYEAQNKTGNKVLDTLLTAKSLYCRKNDIIMTSVVDGTLFGFMDVMDICSIFGNALDNAIEHEKQILDKDKRIINVKAYAQQRFLIIRFENYCEDLVVFQEELPVTTKTDTREHGYGVKSLRYTVRKYGGEVNFELRDSWFIVKILIPMNMSQ